MMIVVPQSRPSQADAAATLCGGLLRVTNAPATPWLTTRGPRYMLRSESREDDRRQFRKERPEGTFSGLHLFRQARADASRVSVARVERLRTRRGRPPRSGVLDVRGATRIRVRIG
jgi:hypothetical protein